MNSKWYLLRRRIIVGRNQKAIPLADWAKKNNYSIRGARHRVALGKIPGFKHGQKWFVIVPKRT